MSQGSVQVSQAPSWWRWGAFAAALFAAAALLAGCGASAANTASSGPSFGPLNSTSQHAASTGYSAAPYSTPGPRLSAPSSNNSTPDISKAAQPQYVIKSLQTAFGVDDPRQTANDMRQWILATDARAQTVGIDYARQDDGQYNVQLTFSVQAALYPQIENYLANYAQAHGGKLLSLHENVQDVTGQFVDLQSRLATLRVEQQRLLDLLTHSGDLNSILSVDQRLTDVESQIEQIEGQQNQLSGQTTFYNVSISLMPANSVIAGPHPTPWNPGTVLGGAWNAALAVGEALANIVIWLAVFGIYIIPVVVIVLLARHWQRRRQARAAEAH
jgi:hypothetical protein